MQRHGGKSNGWRPKANRGIRLGLRLRHGILVIVLENLRGTKDETFNGLFKHAPNPSFASVIVINCKAVNTTQVAPTSLEAPVAAVSPQAVRLMSLDVFRGATIAAMMLVNNPGSWDAAYKPLLHAEWNGWTFTDLIFPFFLWIVGVAIPLSTARRIDQGQGRTQLLLHTVRRAAIIFALGLFLNSFNYLIDGSLSRDGFSAWFHNWATNIRIPGVLQRIAVCYLVASAIFLRTGIRGQVVAIVSLLLLYVVAYFMYRRKWFVRF
jgi:hypothetical protein